MNLAALLILSFAAGFIAGQVVAFCRNVSLRTSCEDWRKRAIDAERQLDWEHGEMVRVVDPMTRRTRK